MDTQTSKSAVPPLRGVLETSLYVDDIQRSAAFYHEVLGLEPMYHEDRLCAMNVSNQHVLLLFLKGGSTTETVLPGGTIPPHDGNGHLHMALAIDAEQLAPWELRLAQFSVPVIGRVKWPAGGTSIYFHDPDRHVLELITPGVWPNY